MRRGMFVLALATLVAGNAASQQLLDAKSFEGLSLRSIGPALMSGRIADVAIHPEKRSTWYVAVGSGGVWKTTNSGTTWTPIFDDESAYSIGCVTPRLHESGRRFELELRDVEVRLSGDPVRRRLSEPRIPSVSDRISQVVYNDWNTTHGPTTTHRESLAIAEEELESVLASLRRLVETELEDFEDALEEAGAPYTPGRRIP